MSESLFPRPLLRLLLLFGKVWHISFNSVPHPLPKLLVLVKHCLLSVLSDNIVQSHRVNFVSLREVAFEFLEKGSPKNVRPWTLNSNLIYFQHLLKYNV